MEYSKLNAPVKKSTRLFIVIFLIGLIAGSIVFLLPHFYPHTAKASGPQTWFVRPDGGNHYDANTPTGQCDGLANAPYPGTGVNQHCALNDFRYLYDDDAPGNTAWIINGGDTVVVYGCSALPTQANPSNPDCRIGWDQGNGNSPQNEWCAYNYNQWGCSIPPIPSGTPSQPTKILGACAYGTYTCNPVNTYPYTSNNLTQIFGGFALGSVFYLNGSQYVDLEGLEITSHGQCTRYGVPSYPKGCNTDINSPPLDDFAQNGIATNNTTGNILLQDVYIHGFTSSGIGGPIGGSFTLNRVSIDFNVFAGWNFDDGQSTPDAPGSSITQNYVTMIGNGCEEQYPIVNKQFPAVGCWDTNDAGFGDAWSGQNSELDSFTCDHCYIVDNVKDAAIGPHTQLKNLSLTNSVFAGNMGQQGKWGMYPGASTAVIENNLIIGNCTRMSAQLPGAAQNFNESTGLAGSYLTGFCRAAGDVFAFYSNIGGTATFAGNTLIAVSPTIFDLTCGTPNSCATATYNFEDNLFLGYTSNGSYYPNTGEAPGLYYFSDLSVHVNSSHNMEYGVRNGATCDGNISTLITSVGDICSDPLIVNEPTQGAWPPESSMDTFLSNFSPSASSPAIGAGIAVSGLSTDFNGASRNNPPTIGAIELAGSGGGSPPPPSDTTPPTTSITSPSSGATLSGTVSLTASASDNVGVASVFFYVDGAFVGSDASSPYSYSLNTTNLTNGSHTISVRATDTSGNTTNTSSITITVNNISQTPTSTPPSTNPTGPAGYTFCANENGTCSFSGTESVAFGAGSSFYYLTLTNGTPCTDTVFGDPAVYTLKACFTEAVTSTPDITPPTASITSPASGATIAALGSLVSIAASDNVGVTSVQLYVDGILAATDNTAPYAFTLGTLAPGTHTLSAKAHDAALNIGTSPTITVTVPAPSGGGTTGGGGGGGTVSPSLTMTTPTVSNITNSSAYITWSTSNPATHVVKYGIAATSLTGSMTSGTLITPGGVTLTGLGRSKTYYYKAISTDAGGTVVSSTVNSFTTNQRPGKVKNLSAKNGSVLLSWQPADGTYASIIITRSTTTYPTSPTTNILTTLAPSATAYHDTKVATGTTYYYAVFAVDSVGNASDPANIAFTAGGTGAASSIVTSVVVTSVSGNAAKVTVTTSQPASIQLKYGVTTAFGMTTQSTPYLTTNYVNLVNLTSNTIYDLVAIATPQSGGPLSESSVTTLQTQALATPVNATSGPFTTALAYGDTSPQVTLLQNMLKDQGFFPETVASTGYFGVTTEHAVLLFQAAHQLNRSGFVDQQTASLLNKIVAAQGTTTPTPTTGSGSSSGSLTQNLAPGSTGPQVTILQHMLTEDGDYTAGLFTTYYGSLTEAAVKAFQVKYGIISYGSPESTGYGAVGPKTRAKLNAVE